MSVAYAPELHRIDYWEKQILDEFELDDDNQLDEEDLRDFIGDILAKEP